MTGWQVAAACACAAPGIILGVLLAVRRQWTIGTLLIALGAMPLVLLSPDSSGQPAGASTPQGIHFIVAVLGASSWIWFYLPPTLLAIYFPDGRLPSPRWRWFLVGWAVFAVVFSFAVAGDPESYGDGPGQIPGHPPDQLSQSVSSVVGLVALALLLCLLVSSFVAVALRYKRGSAVVRRQIKWFAMSALLLPFVLVATWIAYAFTEYADVVVVVGLLAVFVSVPITVATAVLRHDLYDIDQLLSRTVSYALISGLLTALFATAVVGVGLLVGQGSDITVAVATVACALAFGPIRRRVQDLVDAHFDRTHRDALALVADFVDAVRDGSSEPEEIEDTLRRAIRSCAWYMPFRATRTHHGGTGPGRRRAIRRSRSSTLRSAGASWVRSPCPQLRSVPGSSATCSARPTFRLSWRVRALSFVMRWQRQRRRAPGC
jgi:hypothetical protein